MSPFLLRRLVRATTPFLVLALTALTALTAPPAHGQTPAGIPPSPRESGITSLAEVGRCWAVVAEEQAASGDFSGGIHLSGPDGIVVEQLWGNPVAGRQDGFDRDTRFNVASMGKMFTAVAIGQLLDEGRLGLADPVGKYYPEFPWPEYADRITIEHLLTHRSGLGSYDFGHGESGVEAIVEKAAGTPVAFEPGSDMRYSNTGYAVLGVVIERISGIDYFEYIRRNVFGRIGMDRSGFFRATDPVDNMALGYTRMGADGRPAPGPRRPNAELIEATGSPAGGAYSTVRDMQRFGEALLSDELLSRRTRDELWRGRAAIGPSTRYGLGFGRRVSDGVSSAGHNGGAPGIGADFQVFPDLGLVQVVFTNFDPEPVMVLSRELVRLLGALQEEGG